MELSNISKQKFIWNYLRMLKILAVYEICWIRKKNIYTI